MLALTPPYQRPCMLGYPSQCEGCVAQSSHSLLTWPRVSTHRADKRATAEGAAYSGGIRPPPRPSPCPGEGVIGAPFQSGRRRLRPSRGSLACFPANSAQTRRCGGDARPLRGFWQAQGKGVLKTRIRSRKTAVTTPLSDYRPRVWAASPRVHGRVNTSSGARIFPHAPQPGAGRVP